MSARPKILFLSPSWPHGHTFGGQLRALHTARALKAIGSVTLMVVGSEAGDAEAALLSAAEFRIAPAVPAALHPNHGAWKRLRWAIDLQYLNVHGYVTSAEDRARVISQFDEYDLVWVLNSRTPNLLQIWRWPHSHLDLDDIPSSYLLRTATTERVTVDRLKAHTQRVLLHRRERHLTDRFTTLSVCSEADRDYLGHDRVHVIPNGFARPQETPHYAPTTNPPRLGFIGLYSYPPNHDGIQWFLHSVWPAVRQAVPGVRFRLVGRGTDGPQKPVAPDVDTLGWLDDPAAEIATWSAMVIPIRIGGGTRIKLADAFSRKCPVVSTQFGAYGYSVQSGKEVLLADEPESFARACVNLIQYPDLGQRLAETAWQEYLRHWTWDAIAPKVWAAAEDCLSRSGKRAEFQSSS